MTGAAQTSSRASILKRPWRVRCAKSTAAPASGTLCTVRPSRCPAWAGAGRSGGRLAARANEASDDLEPDIQNCHQATKPQPLKGVTAVLVHAGVDRGPVAPQTLAGWPGLQHREIGQRQAGLGTKRGQVEILPDTGRCAISALELVQPRRGRGHPP